MRRLLLGSILPLLATTALAAQSFEGTMTIKSASNFGGSSDMTMYVKGGRMAMSFTLPANAGQMAGKEGKVIVDPVAMNATMLIPMEMGGMKGVKQVINMRQGQADTSSVVVKSLGTSETIAGYKCDDIQVSNARNVSVICITTQLGQFAFPSTGMMGRNSAWASFFNSHPGYPLRVTDNGKVQFEVTSVKPGTVPVDAFTIPDGYQDMSGMMGGRGPQV